MFMQTTDSLDWSNILPQLQNYLDARALIIVVVLYAIGMALKKTPRFSDWLIIWTLTGLGIIAALFLLGTSVASVFQGIIAAALAVYAHQLFKQTTDKN